MTREPRKRSAYWARLREERRRERKAEQFRERREALEGAGQLALGLEPEGLSVSDLAAAYHDFTPNAGRRRRRT